MLAAMSDEEVRDLLRPKPEFVSGTGQPLDGFGEAMDKLGVVTQPDGSLVATALGEVEADV